VERYLRCIYNPVGLSVGKELDGLAVSVLRRAIAEAKQRWLVIGWVTKDLFPRVSEGTLSRWSRLHLQSLAPTNPHSVRLVDYGSLSLCVINKEGLCRCSGEINRLMIMMICHLINRGSRVDFNVCATFVISHSFF
jgi:hypothetical protein